MPFPAVHPALDRALAARGYTEPTPVQRAVIEADQNNPDMLVSAQTGSGKTVAFGLVLASTLLGDDTHIPAVSRPRALVIAPTRELAIQISREFEWLFADTGAHIAIAVGGMSVRSEQQKLARGAHIVIGTPGRLCDHVSRGFLDLSSLQVVVLDEADEMLDLGFREELESLLDATPTESRRTLLFSATIPRGIALLAQDYQRDAIRIDTTSATTPHGDIDYRVMTIAQGEAEHAVVNVLRYFEPGAALVFCATRESVRRLHTNLLERGFQVVALSGEMNQRERNEALQALRDGRAKVCVATDVAARGLDLPDLSLVIHADLPTNKATLLHRSGRTGRAGRKGLSVLLVPHAKRRRTEQVLASANVRATWRNPPTADEIYSQDSQRLADHPALQASLSPQDMTLAARMVQTLSAEQLAAALIGLLRKALPEPADVSIGPGSQSRQTSGIQTAAAADRRGDPATGAFRTDESTAWFRLNVGRQGNADPKWIIPLICRRGGVTKAEIGPIRIFRDETKVAIRGDAAAGFASAIGETAGEDIEIRPTTPPSSGEPAMSARVHRREGGHEEEPRRQGATSADQLVSYRPGPSRRRTKETGPHGDQEKAQEGTRMATGAASAASARPPGPTHRSPSASPAGGLNRKQRRDAARAAGQLAPVSTDQTGSSPRRAVPPDRSQPPSEAAHRRADSRSAGDRPAYATTPGNKGAVPRKDVSQRAGRDALRQNNVVASGHAILERPRKGRPFKGKRRTSGGGPGAKRPGGMPGRGSR